MAERTCLGSASLGFEASVAYFVACSAAVHVAMAPSPKAPTLNERPSRGRELLSRFDTFEQPAPVIRPDTSSWLRTHAFASCLNAPNRCLCTSSASHSEPTCPLLTTSRSTYGGDGDGMGEHGRQLRERDANASFDSATAPVAPKGVTAL